MQKGNLGSHSICIVTDSSCNQREQSVPIKQMLTNAYSDFNVIHISLRERKSVKCVAYVYVCVKACTDICICTQVIPFDI